MEKTMVQLNKTYDDSQPGMSDGGFALQEGEHGFMIMSEEVKDTAAMNGNRYLQYNCVVDAGMQAGTEFAIRLNFWNSNPIAVEIAEKEFNSLRTACGVGATNDSAHLVQRRAIATVARKTKGKNIGEVYIKEYAPAGVAAAAAPVQQPLPVAPPAGYANPAPTAGAPAVPQGPAPTAAPAAPWRQ
jgi:hypothetical protein